MRYKSFSISNYRAIVEPITIGLSRKTLIPIIGINECGKTTILQGIYAFDYFNDNEYKGQHLLNTLNLYKTSEEDPIVKAKIEIDYNILTAYWDAIKAKQDPATQAQFNTITIDKISFNNELTILRNLITKMYSIDKFDDNFPPPVQDQLARKIISSMPYILYNDDFQDRPPDLLDIPNEKPEEISDWLAIYERLFNATNNGYSLFSVIKEPDSRRKDSIVSDVQSHLNSTLSKAWKTFLLDRGKNISVRLQILTNPGNTNPKLEIRIVENVGTVERFFKIVDRSKGFLWFFNFVMKLEFNPKIAGDYRDTVYLLDEPGSYLHSAAQEKLCSKLKSISELYGHVIYCTHSHHLLNPDLIPINNIYIVSKLPTKNISITPLPLASTISERTTALRPVFEALQIPNFEFLVDDSPMIVVEGIYDKYAIKLFITEMGQYKILAGTSADSIIKNIQFLNAYGTNYIAIWDNDDEGRRTKKRAEYLFGPRESCRFDLLPSQEGGKDRKMENMISKEDMIMIKDDLNLSQDSSYESTILELFYSNSRKRKSILGKISPNTMVNFNALNAIINKRISLSKQLYSNNS